MKVLLKIGYREYLLPNDQGVSTLAKTLSKAREARVTYDPESTKHEEMITIEGGAPKIEVRYLDAKTKVQDNTLPLGLPEHGTPPN